MSGWSRLLALAPVLPVLVLAGAGLGRYHRQWRRARRARFLADLERDVITALYPTSAVGAGRALASARYQRALAAPAPANAATRAAGRERGAPAGARGPRPRAMPGAQRASPQPR